MLSKNFTFFLDEFLTSPMILPFSIANQRKEKASHDEHGTNCQLLLVTDAAEQKLDCLLRVFYLAALAASFAASSALMVCMY